MKQMVYFKILNDDCQLWKYYAANWIKKANSAKDLILLCSLFVESCIFQSTKIPRLTLLAHLGIFFTKSFISCQLGVTGLLLANL